MKRKCYDCGNEYLFRDDAPETSVFLCFTDAQFRREHRLFDGMRNSYPNFEKSTKLVMNGEPVEISHSRIFESKQVGLFHKAVH